MLNIYEARHFHIIPSRARFSPFFSSSHEIILYFSLYAYNAAHAARFGAVGFETQADQSNTRAPLLLASHPGRQRQRATT